MPTTYTPPKIVIKKPKKLNIVIDQEPKIVRPVTEIIFDGNNADTTNIDGGEF